MPKKKQSVRSQKKPVPSPVVLFIAEVEGWHAKTGICWNMLTMVPSQVRDEA
jgi:hypothetical protein